MARLKSRLESIEPDAAPPGDPPSHLHDGIARVTNREELRQLAYAVGANTEDFSGEGLTQMALELTLWAQRRGKWRELLAELTRTRPAVDWSVYEK